MFRKAYYSVYLSISSKNGNDSYQASSNNINGNSSSELSNTGAKQHFDKQQKINSSIAKNQDINILYLFTNEGCQDFSKILKNPNSC